MEKQSPYTAPDSRLTPKIWALADHYNQLNLICERTPTFYNSIIGNECGNSVACELRANVLHDFFGIQTGYTR